MRCLLAYRVFSSFAGSEIYLLTVAEQLQLLGHDVAIHALERGPVADFAEQRGVRVIGQEDLPRECDALLVQDAATALTLAERYPSAARAYVAHSTEFVSQQPPQADGVLGAVIALNDRVASAIRAGATPAEVVRLRQPVDLIRFSRYGRVPDRPKRMLVFGHDHGGEQLARLWRAGLTLGLDVTLVGRRGRTSPTPELEIADADVVVGIGRCVLEALACRTAAYVSGVVGTDGWVTPDSYPALEADGFSGRASGRVLDEDRLCADLAAWTPELAEQGKDLAFAHHDAARHAVELVELWRRLGATGPPPDAASELARLGRVAAQAEDRALAYSAEAGVQRRKAEALRGELDALRATRRYWLAGLLSRPLDALRRLCGRPPSRD
jgi:hypothetical protein